MDLGAVPERPFPLGRQRKGEAAPRSQMARSKGNLNWAGYGTHAGRHAAARQCRRKPLGFCVILVGRVCTALAQGAGVLVGFVQPLPAAPSRRSASGMLELVPSLVRVDVSSQVHGVVEDPADDQHVPVASTDEEVPRTVDRLFGSAGPTVREVPGEDSLSELWAGCVSGVVAARCGVPDSSGDQCLIVLAGPPAELFVGPCEDRDDVGSGGMGKAISRHQPADCVRAAACTPSCPMKSSRLSSAISS